MRYDGTYVYTRLSAPSGLNLVSDETASVCIDSLAAPLQTQNQTMSACGRVLLVCCLAAMCPLAVIGGRPKKRKGGNKSARSGRGFVGSHGQQLRQYFQNDDLEGGAEFVKDLSNRLSGPGLISAQESVSTERLNLNLDERVRAQYEIGAEQTSFSPLGFALMLSRMKPGRGPDKLASALIEAGMCSTEQNDLGLALSLNRVTYAERLLASPCKVHCI